jgi:protein-disulfide isomerase/uncharacterized membrane protein
MAKERLNAPAIAPMSAVILLAVSLAFTLLALFQWMELFLVRAGGQSVCSISAVVNCEAVWNSAFASRIHRALGIPVAALGIVWGATAFGLSALLVYRLIDGSSPRAAIAGLRLTAAAGILACITFAVASMKTGAVCLTCLATFVLVVAFAGSAARLLPGPLVPSRDELTPALLWSLGLALAAYLLVLAPGLSTPKAASVAVSSFQSSGRPSDESAARLRDFLLKLPKDQQQVISDALSVYQHSPTVQPEKFGARNRRGPSNAPVKIVEFTDIRCPHCAELLLLIKEIERVVPEGRVAVEARNFPLDESCNPSLRGVDPTGVRCLGAKALICLERAPDFWEVREKLFEEQETLTADRALEIASSGSMPRRELEACIASPKTAELLKQDIDYAMRYSPAGTPFILINGREARFFPPFIFAMVMSGGNPQSPAFQGLPSPSAGLP